MTVERSAALVIRVWLEGGDDGFRGRLTAADLPGDGAPTDEATVAVATSPQDVVTAVDEWLDEFIRRYRRTAGS